MDHVSEVMAQASREGEAFRRYGQNACGVKKATKTLALESENLQKEGREEKLPILLEVD